MQPVTANKPIHKLKKPSKCLAFSFVIPTPFGPLGFITQNDKLHSINFLASGTPLLPPIINNDKRIAEDVLRYFKNPQHRFSCELVVEGTPFQQSVWKSLQSIPVGKTVSYATLAKQLKTSPRAIGQACRTNPLPIIIPCHRVVAAKHVGGFAGKRDGEMLAIKQWLLSHEK